MLNRLRICKLIIMLTAWVVSQPIMAAADHWQLNGYARETTPLLKQLRDCTDRIDAPFVPSSPAGSSTAGGINAMTSLPGKPPGG